MKKERGIFTWFFHGQGSASGVVRDLRDSVEGCRRRADGEQRGGHFVQPQYQVVKGCLASAATWFRAQLDRLAWPGGGEA